MLTAAMATQRNPERDDATEHRPEVHQPPPERRLSSQYNDSQPSRNNFYAGESRQSMLAKRLPVVHIRPFHGDPNNWPIFAKDFKNSVHNILDEDSDRLTILQQLLSIDVRRQMARYLHDLALYQQAWNMLETRYGNPA